MPLVLSKTLLFSKKLPIHFSIAQSYCSMTLQIKHVNICYVFMIQSCKKFSVLVPNLGTKSHIVNFSYLYLYKILGFRIVASTFQPFTQCPNHWFSECYIRQISESRNFGVLYFIFDTISGSCNKSFYMLTQRQHHFC